MKSFFLLWLRRRDHKSTENRPGEEVRNSVTGPSIQRWSGSDKRVLGGRDRDLSFWRWIRRRRTWLLYRVEKKKGRPLSRKTVAHPCRFQRSDDYFTPFHLLSAAALPAYFPRWRVVALPLRSHSAGLWYTCSPPLFSLHRALPTRGSVGLGSSLLGSGPSPQAPETSTTCPR